MKCHCFYEVCWQALGAREKASKKAKQDQPTVGLRALETCTAISFICYVPCFLFSLATIVARTTRLEYIAGDGQADKLGMGLIDVKSPSYADFVPEIFWGLRLLLSPAGTSCRSCGGQSFTLQYEWSGRKRAQQEQRQQPTTNNTIHQSHNQNNQLQQDPTSFWFCCS